ncbi:MAG: hypothetical protein O6849_02820 [Candidatus Dadabacteria bacterium]|jgi:hypothetical protein|nr:hypothetical protein [Deltaproteobacteria bacterium]MCK5709480.1 hypothetical protein [Deltaproteobacteria bacterium]MCZ6684903.1 hypothetical protein [Candidatus Dadabacteria bacterium]
MKNLFLILSFMFCITTGIAVSEENKGEETQQQSDSIKDQTDSEKDCSKVCVKRDGYGKCTEFEERCEE